MNDTTAFHDKYDVEYNNVGKQENTPFFLKRNALNNQVGGTHYQECKIQPIEFIEANGLSFLEGSIVKRIARHGKPTGKGKEDIKKVIHEAQLLLQLRYGENV